MHGLRAGFARIDQAIVDFTAKYAIPFLHIALAIIYIWFGALKIAGASPVAALVEKMAYGVPKGPFVRFVGVWEVVVGVSLLFRIALRLTLALFALQMAGTFLLFVLHPRETFRNNNPLLLTQTGEFIIKNLALLAGGMAIAGTIRRERGRTDEPQG